MGRWWSSADLSRWRDEVLVEIKVNRTGTTGTSQNPLREKGETDKTTTEWRKKNNGGGKKSSRRVCWGGERERKAPREDGNQTDCSQGQGLWLAILPTTSGNYGPNGRHRS